MAETFYTILTSAGLAKLANAQVTGQKVNLTEIAVGDGGGSYYNPTTNDTRLRNEVWRGNIGSVEIDPENPNWIVIESYIPSTEGGFMVREVAVFDDKGEAIAIGKYPETYKPAVEDGASKDLLLRMIIEVSNASAVTLKVDPAVIIASRKYVDEKVSVVSTNLTQLEQDYMSHKAENTPQIYSSNPKKTNFKQQVLTIFNNDHGFTLSSGAGTSITNDTTVHRTGVQSLKMTGTTTVMADKTTELNLFNKVIMVDVFVPDVSNVDNITVVLDVSTNFSSYFAYDVRRAVLRNGWNTLTLNANSFVKIGSTTPTLADLTSVKKVRLKMTPTPGVEGTVYVDRISYYENGLERGKVIFTFDDGHETVYNVAKPIMDRYGFPGVAYIITDSIGTEGKMTIEQLKEMQNTGWDISSHTATHKYFTQVTHDEVVEELQRSKQWLMKNGFVKGSQHLATPGGQYNPEILETIKKYYNTHRTIIEKEEVFPEPDLHQLKIRNVVNTTTISTVQTWIDRAAENREVLILCFHYIMDPADTSTKITPTLFQGIVDYIASSVNVDVITMSDYVSMMDNALAEPKTTVTLPNGYNAQTPPSKFPRNKVTHTRISLANSAGFPNNAAGLLVTDTTGYTSATQGWVYQLYHVYESNEVYKRVSNESGTWSNWEILSNFIHKMEINSVTADSPYTDFPANKISYCQIQTLGAATFPEAKAGMLITNRMAGGFGFVWQEYEVYNSWNKYKRYLDATGAWSEWRQVTIT